MHTLTDPLRLASVRIATFEGSRDPLGASGFLFRRDERLDFVGSGCVEAEDEHFPDRIALALNTGSTMLAATLPSVRAACSPDIL